MRKSLAKACLCAVAGITLSLSPAQAQQNTSDIETGPMTGLYAGGFGGFSWTDAETSAGDFDVNGGDYGLFMGYQLDTLLDDMMGITGAIEAHYAWSDADDSSGGIGVEKDHEWGVSFRPGLSFIDRYSPFGVKPYGIIGYRQAEFEASGGGLSGNETFDGFELGIGTELVAYQNFGVRVDYSHVWYEENNGIDPDEDDIRLGLAYHF